MSLLVLDLEKNKVLTREELISDLADAIAERLRPVVDDPYEDYPDLLTRKQVMKILSISASTLWRMVEDPSSDFAVHSRLGKSPRFLKTDVLDLLKSIKK